MLLVPRSSGASSPPKAAQDRPRFQPVGTVDADYHLLASVIQSRVKCGAKIDKPNGREEVIHRPSAREKHMDAAVLHALGEPPRCEQFPEPIAGDDEVIVHVHAASLKPIDKQLAGGSHYASPREFPLVCGSDGVGHLSDGQRVFFGGTRAPYGAMAQRTVVRSAFSFPVPEGVDDDTAAALPNPGVSGLAHTCLPRQAGAR